MRSEVCSYDGCGQEVRWGWRDGRKAYWHRDDVGHEPVFGRRMTAADKAEVERQLDLPRTRERVTKDGETVVEEYTARGYFLDRMKKAARERLLEEGLDEEEIAALQEVIPEPEVRKTTITREDPRCPQGVKNLMNAAAKAGWEVRRLTYARGPWLGAKGNVLSISDTVAIGVVDSDRVYAVACWRDGKVVSAWLGTREGDQVRMSLTTITAIKTYMKGAAS